jgi:hypothetical protein
MIGKNFLRKRVLLIFALLPMLAGCFGQGKDQLSQMFNANFSSTVVCESQVQELPFQNVSDEETVIAGIAISGGTDPIGNFSFQGITIDGQFTPSISGALQDIHIPARKNYSLRVNYTPKIVDEDKSPQSAILDISYSAPQPGIVQVVLSGTPDGNVNASCNGGGDGGPVSLDGPATLTVNLMIAATSAVNAPINTNQGQQPFVPISLDLNFNKTAGTVSIDAYTEDGFILPPPVSNAPAIGGIIKGETNITIPTGGSGTYDAATGDINIPNLLIHMDGDLDFSADLTLTLTTKNIKVASISPRVTRGALQEFKSAAGVVQWDSRIDVNEIFGSPISSEDGHVILVGLTKMQNVVVKPGARPELQNLPTASMAVLIEGTIEQ